MAAPSLQVFAGARGAAYIVYNIIDQVCMHVHFTYCKMLHKFNSMVQGQNKSPSFNGSHNPGSPYVDFRYR